MIVLSCAFTNNSEDTECCHPGNADPPTNYPAEVSAKEAGRILGCSKDTVLKFKDAGLLEYRNLASPNSSRSRYRFRRESAEKLRTEYQIDLQTPPTPKEPRRRRVRESRPNEFKHLRLG